MSGIFPDPTTGGGLVVRDGETGLPVSQIDVKKAYIPSPTFLMNCDMTALPTDCTARIESSQINAIVSELVSFAECMDPNGPWDCNSLQNLCHAFTAWVALNIRPPVIVSDFPPSSPRPNDLWYETDTGMLFIWYADVNSQAWVQCSTGNNIVDGTSIVGEGSVSSPHHVNLVNCGSW